MSLTEWALLQGAVLAYALLGGVFLAFSDFIMRALSLSRGSGGVEAMQAINREVFRWAFMTMFLGMAVGSLALLVFALVTLEGFPRLLVAASGLVYLLGCFAVTVAGNVPLNEALAKMDLAEPSTTAYWSSTYLPRWTRWNTVRTLACGLSSVLLMSGLLAVAAADGLPG